MSYKEFFRSDGDAADFKVRMRDRWPLYLERRYETNVAAASHLGVTEMSVRNWKSGIGLPSGPVVARAFIDDPDGMRAVLTGDPDEAGS